jgi:hypothetical protein
MAQTGFTPILIYSSSTAAAAPNASNLTNSTLGSELAINITDGKLFYKDNANVVQVIGWKTVPTTAGGTGLTTYTAGDLLYYATGTSLNKLGIGATNTVLTSSGTAPQWSTGLNLTSLTVTNGSSNTNVSLNSNADAILAVGRYSSNASGPQVVLRKLRGSIASPTTVVANDISGDVFSQAYDGTNLLNATLIRSTVDTVTGAGNINTRMSFLTRPTGGADVVERMILFGSGGLSLGNTTNPGTANFSLGSLVSTSTATPNTLSLGGTYSNTEGANPKLRVFWDGSNASGLGVSANGMDYIGAGAAHHKFFSNGAYVGGFDTGGRFLVNTTDTGALFQSATTTSAVSARIANTLSTGLTADIFQVTALNHPSGTGFHLIRCYTSGPTVQFAVRGDGTVYAQNTTIQSLSDIRTKENVRESENGLDVIMALRPVRFDFKKGFGNEKKNVLGFVAQEVETVFPDAVDVVNDPDGDGPEEPYKSVGPSALIPVLVKAIQELNDKLKAANVAGF